MFNNSVFFVGMYLTVPIPQPTPVDISAHSSPSSLRHPVLQRCRPPLQSQWSPLPQPPSTISTTCASTFLFLCLFSTPSGVPCPVPTLPTWSHPTPPSVTFGWVVSTPEFDLQLQNTHSVTGEVGKRDKTKCKCCCWCCWSWGI